VLLRLSWRWLWINSILGCVLLRLSWGWLKLQYSRLCITAALLGWLWNYSILGCVLLRLSWGWPRNYSILGCVIKVNVAKLGLWAVRIVQSVYPVAAAWTVLVSTAGRGKRFPLLQNIPEWLWGPPSPLFQGYRCSFQAVTRLDSDVHSLQSTTEVKNEWSYTSTLSVCLHELTGNCFYFIFSLRIMLYTDSVCKARLNTSVTTTEHGPE